MPEAFDLRKMLEEIVEDEKVSASKRKKISQADIKRMLRARSQKARGEHRSKDESEDNTPADEFASDSAPKHADRGSPASPGQETPPARIKTGLDASGHAAGVPAPMSIVSTAPGFTGNGSSSPSSLVPARILRKHRAVPILLDGRTLHIGMEDPGNVRAIHEIEFASGMRVRPVPIPVERLTELLRSIENGCDRLFALADAAEDQPDTTRIREVLRRLVNSSGFDLIVTAGSTPVIKSHMGLESSGLAPFTSDQCVACAEGLMTERQWEDFLRQGMLDFPLDLPGFGRFRINACRQRDTVSLTIRRIPMRVPSLKELELPASLDSIVMKPHGLAIFASPTGQGKTTTLNALLHLINTSMSRNIITLEDPIEFVHVPARSVISQREIGRDTASFSDGLRSIFRQAPDVIVVGEVQDPETFQLALDTASSGHLVLCTMRAFNTTTAVDNMVHRFPHHLRAYIRHQLAESLLLVFSQRLVPTVDGQSLIVLHETLFNSPRIKELLRQGKIGTLRAQLHQGEEDFVPMDACLKELLHAGKIAVQDGALLAENPALVLGADIL